MKGKLLIEPGFESGSLYCGDCLLFENEECLVPGWYAGYEPPEYEPVLRSPECLNAEIKTPVMPTPPPIRIIQDDKFLSGELKMMILYVVLVAACLSAILFVVYHL